MLDFSTGDLFWTYLVLIGLGFVVGLFSGLLGLGGGWLITPALNVFGLPATVCVGTSLTQMVGTSAIGAFTHGRRGNIRLKLGFAFGIPLVFGVHIGKTILLMLSSMGVADSFFRLFYIILLLIMGILMVRESLGARRRNEEVHQRTWHLLDFGPSLHAGDGLMIPWWLVLTLGLTAGLVSGILGIGGGLLLVPAMAYLLGMPTVIAVGTSLFCIMLGSIYGSVRFAMDGHVDFVVAGLIFAGSLGGSSVGTNLSKRTKDSSLRLLFAVLVLVTAVSLVFTQIGWTIPSQIVLFGGAATLTLAVLMSVKRQKVESG